MNIYVGNLPKTATEDSIRQAFETHGEVSQVKLIKDNFSGEPRGFGFVEMPSKSEAVAAIAALNGADFEGKNLTVNEARPRAERPGGGGGGGRRGGGGGFGGGRSRSW
ncbi:MAG TPA: RNA-binding protein [bacterium]|nr:RNA-binding protein [bacterium]